MCVLFDYELLSLFFLISVLESFVSVVTIKAGSYVCSSFPFHTAVIHMTVLEEIVSSGLIATKIYQ